MQRATDNKDRTKINEEPRKQCIDSITGYFKIKARLANPRQIAPQKKMTQNDKIGDQVVVTLTAFQGIIKEYFENLDSRS